GVYRDIGRLVAQRGPHAWDGRAVVSRRRKMYRALQGGAQALAAVSLARMRQQTPRGNLWRKVDS
ncbi:MAG: phytoene/squalene synthase family protein, partial [Gammaproteobacteria bacterium]